MRALIIVAAVLALLIGFALAVFWVVPAADAHYLTAARAKRALKGHPGDNDIRRKVHELESYGLNIVRARQVGVPIRYRAHRVGFAWKFTRDCSPYCVPNFYVRFFMSTLRRGSNRIHDWPMTAG